MKLRDILDDERTDGPLARTGATDARSGTGAEGLTLASAWQATSGGEFTDELLAWPSDMFALTNVLLDRSEAFRFVLSPPAGVRWPPADARDWSDAVVEAGRDWSAWAEDRRGSVPDLVAKEWRVVLQRADLPLADLAAGRDWRVCQALLSLHAIADEACAGLGSATERGEGPGARYRARARELLARTGSLARIAPRQVRVLPKVRTPPSGRTAFSRYACVQGAGLEASWHKLPSRHLGTDPRAEYVNLLLLPWPLRVRASDFRAVEGSVQLEHDPFGFFEFAPAERLDLDLVDRVLTAALEEVDSVDVVVLPEAALDETEIDELEAVLDRHGVAYRTAGIRQRPPGPGQLPSNWVHRRGSQAAQGRRVAGRPRPAMVPRPAEQTPSVVARTRIRFTSTTWQVPFTRRCGGARRWRYPRGRCSSCRSARRSRSSPSCARTWPKPTRSPTSSAPSARPLCSRSCWTDRNWRPGGRHGTRASWPTTQDRSSSR